MPPASRASSSSSGGRVAGLLLAAVALAGSPVAADLAEVRARGTLRVLAGTNEQPEMFAFEGARPGFERELLDGFARLHRLRLEVVAIRDRDERVPALRRGAGDILVGLVVTPARQQLVAFSTQVLPAPHLVVTLAPHRAIRSVGELREERVGVLENASWTSDLAAVGVPSARTVVYPDRTAAMKALQAGEVSATVMSLFNFALVAKDTPALQAGMRLGEDGHSAWAVRKEDVELRKAVDAYLQMVQASATWSRLVVKYFGERALEVLGRAQRKSDGR